MKVSKLLTTYKGHCIIYDAYLKNWMVTIDKSIHSKLRYAKNWIDYLTQ